MHSQTKIIDAVRDEKTSAETMGSSNFTLHWSLPFGFLHLAPLQRHGSRAWITTPLLGALNCSENLLVALLGV